MFKFRRWWLLCGAVLVGVVALNGVVNGVAEAKVAPAPRAVCVRDGAKARDGVSGRRLVCVQTKVRGLRWRFQPTTVTTPATTTTLPGVVAPVLVSVSASDGVRVTVAGMQPDTGVYSLQWVPYGQSFNTFHMARATSASMSVAAGWFACNRTYTFRVFVMQADWQLADGHQTQNVTPHSTPFDVVMPACPAPATTPTTVAPASCATGGVCVVGDTGPGGGIVFYVHASGTFACGATHESTCKYLEVAPNTWSGGSADPTKLWATAAHQSSDVATITNDGSAYNNTLGIGLGYKNSLAIVNQGNDTTTAAGAARAYDGGSQSDWYLPTTAELNLLCQWARNVVQAVTTACTGGSLNTGTGASGGFSLGGYWSSSENDASGAWDQYFINGSQSFDGGKVFTYYVRPVRAFGGTLACADGGVCVVGDTGPGGGIVFYVSATNFTSTGSDCDTTCTYLEAAPAPGGGDVGRSWATPINQTTAVPSPGATALEIGSGMANTNAIQAQSGNVAATSAAVYAYDYTNNSKTDWHLPSQDELNELYTQKTTVGGISSDSYWSSSEFGTDKAWLQDFYGGVQEDSNKSRTRYVRPVRAFG